MFWSPKNKLLEAWIIQLIFEKVSTKCGASLPLDIEHFKVTLHNLNCPTSDHSMYPNPRGLDSQVIPKSCDHRDTQPLPSHVVFCQKSSISNSHLSNPTLSASEIDSSAPSTDLDLFITIQVDRRRNRVPLSANPGGYTGCLTVTSVTRSSRGDCRKLSRSRVTKAGA